MLIHRDEHVGVLDQKTAWHQRYLQRR
jgi:hypothetical protein